jgi:hypothetical protein
MNNKISSPCEKRKAAWILVIFTNSTQSLLQSTFLSTDMIHAAKRQNSRPELAEKQ